MNIWPSWRVFRETGVEHNPNVTVWPRTGHSRGKKRFSAVICYLYNNLATSLIGRRTLLVSNRGSSSSVYLLLNAIVRRLNVLFKYN